MMAVYKPFTHHSLCCRQLGTLLVLGLVFSLWLEDGAWMVHLAPEAYVEWGPISLGGGQILTDKTKKLTSAPIHHQPQPDQVCNTVILLQDPVSHSVSPT